MSNEKLKVSDLPKEEQEKLMAEMKNAGLKGLYTAYKVETAKKQIAEKLAKQNGQPPAETIEQNSEENPEEIDNESDEDTEDETNEESEDDESDEDTEDETNEESEDDESDEDTEDETNEESEDNESDEDTEDETPKEKKVPICHICRTRVIKDKCPGCGFQLRV